MNSSGLFRIVVYMFLGTHISIAEIFDTFHCTSWSCGRHSNLLQGNRYFNMMGCFCDDLCSFYDDCCPDVNFTLQKDLDVSMHNYISCIHDCDVSIDMYFHSVTECPREYSKPDIARLCTMDTSDDKFYGLPVWGMKTGLTYRNIFCAKCHGEDALFWQIHGHCYVAATFQAKDTITLSEINANGACLLNYLPSRKDRFRACLPNVISICSNVSNPHADACVNTFGFQLVYNLDGKVYRNLHCAACNEELNLTCRKPKKPPCRPTLLPPFPTIAEFSYDINTHQGYFMIHSKKRDSKRPFEMRHQCLPSEIFNPFSEECWALSCGSKQTLENGKCLNITDEAVTPGFSHCGASSNKDSMCCQEHNKTLCSGLSLAMPLVSLQLLMLSTYGFVLFSIP